MFLFVGFRSYILIGNVMFQQKIDRADFVEKLKGGKKE